MKDTTTTHFEGSMNTIASARPAVESPKKLQYGLWTAQVLLAVVFAVTGYMKLTISDADLARALPVGGLISIGLIRFIGVAELAGAIGLILPSATRILPVLTPIAAGALALVMALAALLHASRGEIGSVLGVLVLGALALFVVWGRTTRAAIPARSNTSM
jgi:putative oxidoreductase